MSKLSPNLTITAILAIPSAIYLFSTYNALRPSFNYPIRASRTIPASLASSRTIKAIVNPSGHPFGGDTHSVIIPRSQLPRARDGRPLTDRELLGKLVNGFYGGWVFAPERWALWAWRMVGGGSLVDVRMIEEEARRIGKEAWSAENVRDITKEKEGWEVGTRVSGTFQVVNVKIGDEGSSKVLTEGDSGETESYVDFVFGSDEGRLKGVHRLSVLRRRDEQEKEEEMYELRLAGVACNPRAKQALPSWMIGFHMAYAKLLFREAVAEVTRTKAEESGR